MTQARQLANAPKPGVGIASQATHIETSRAVAEVQAMVVVAQRNPRSVTEARNAIIETCRQMGLAERAFFKFPRGGQTVSGPSIHLAVELARCWGNINYGIKELSRDDAAHQSEILAYAWDLQTNARSETITIVPHMRDKRGGAEVLTDMRDIYENNANSGARRLREMIFRAIPTWLLEEAKAECMRTLEKGESEQPLPQRIAVALQMFADMGIVRERIEAKIGMNMDRMTALDLANLRVSYQSIKRNEISAAEEFPEVAAVQATAALRQAAQQPTAQADNRAIPPPAETVDQETGEVTEPKPPAADAPKVGSGWQPAILPPLRADGNMVAWANDAVQKISEVLPRVLPEIEEEMKNIAMIDAIHGQLARAISARKGKK